ncbi:galactokinase family protein [Actinomadura rudentiformis]|uniref:Galactokinase family protein n=1 Tax=Actinomadura rudentiformis TaxID=359158 RepID=A0A6H9YW77_9ACTN|nr:galactokinase family protein [Actinomadura rudentiformis]KAB2346563.1 galactokinase family protein [Actinomadura rudentiformis]
MIHAGGGAAVAELAVDPEVRITAHVFERAYGSAPAGVWRAPGGLTLLGGDPALAVALPWGVMVALGATDDGSAAFYSTSHHAEGFSAGCGELPSALASGAVPEWALTAVNALIAHDQPGRTRPVTRASGMRVMINRELPDEMGLLTGAETACAIELGLRELYAAEARPYDPTPSYAAAMEARPKRALLVADTIEHLPFDLAAVGLRLLIMDVGVGTAVPVHPAGDLAERAASALRAGNFPALGALLTEAHSRGEPLLDLALDAARAAGALGGLVIGRCGVALVPMAAVPKIRAAVTRRLAGEARRPPRFLTAVPAAHKAARAL